MDRGSKAKQNAKSEDRQSRISASSKQLEPPERHYLAFNRWEDLQPNSMALNGILDRSEFSREAQELEFLSRRAQIWNLIKEGLD